MLPVVAIVGRPNVGKSTLFNHLTRSRDALISEYPGTTRDRLYGEVDRCERRFLLIDTGGLTEVWRYCQQANHPTSAPSYKRCQIKSFFLIDGQSGLTSEDRSIANTLRKTGKSIICWLPIKPKAWMQRFH